MKIGNNIRKIRELKNLTQQYMADAMGISQPQYSRIENDVEELSMSELTEIARVLEVDPVQLITFDSNQYISNISHSQVENGQYFDQRTVSAAEFDLVKTQLQALQSELGFLRKLLEKKLLS